jgi:putative MATE family efflux protein
MKLAIPAALEQFVLQIGLLFYARFIVSMGTIILSGYQIGVQVLNLSFIPNAGFGVASGTLVGQNLGAGRKKEAKKTGWVCMFWGVASISVLALVYYNFAPNIASIYVKNPEVVEVATSFIRMVAYAQFLMVTYFTLSGTLRVAGDTRFPLYITLLGMYGVRIPGAYFLTRYGYPVSIVFSLLFFDYVVRVIAILIRYHRGRWLEIRV